MGKESLLSCYRFTNRLMQRKDSHAITDYIKFQENHIWKELV